jgi:uracil-DNA glycosylase
MSACPSCSERTVPAWGDGDILFITSAPTDEEYQYGKPFAGKNRQMFSTLLYKHAKIDMNDIRAIPLWYHPKPRSKNWLENPCFLVSLELVLEEMEQYDRIVLVGADAVRHFTGRSIDAVNGCDVTDFIDAEGKKFFALCSPGTVFTNPGEFYFALDNLKEWNR